ncbi:hypothetical protein B0H67DRAFT_123481 [Lasiosphaeris hirsuta]|uniref:Uncharacterized protein n=1 Tax=Lasiosphaeris hirsuta TaxID=260670 RepID=A0AA40B088_9PEZI|nr:hypothetical protein B0H67DRAFT_123481 [Lasiosphaeris hirsuta]
MDTFVCSLEFLIPRRRISSPSRQAIRISYSLTRYSRLIGGSEKSMVWRRAYEDVAITQSVKNGISMSHQIHFWFYNARFALKPLRETSEGVVVQWHWLKRSILKPLTYIRPNDNMLHQAGVMDWNWGHDLAHRESGMRIRTGQRFLLRADKPE